MASVKSDGGLLIIGFVGILVAVSIIGIVANQVFSLTNILTVANNTVTAASAANATIDIQGRTLLTTISIYNATNATPISLINLGGSLQTGTGSNGLRTVQLILNDTSNYTSEDVNVSYTAEPDGYLTTGSQRSLTNLVTLFAALAILIFSLIVILKGSGSDFIKFSKAR